NQSKASGAVLDEVNLKLFASYMYLAANDAQNAQLELASLYSAYPGDAEVARQYAYVLNFQKNPDEALKILGSLTAKDPGDYYALYLTASSYILKNDAVSALDNMDKFIKITSGNKDLKPTLDKLLYSFSLSFSKILNPDVLNNVEAIKSNVLLYNYIYAIKGWKEQNSDMSNQYIDKVIQADEGLGYALYIKGINNYEKAVRTGQTDFSEAEKYYKKSLGILPNHVEGYFALAHCYKKWGKNLDALRAFRMVTLLLPFEDHRTDPYGMTVHAQGEVAGLLQYDIKDGE
ncbi:MAG: tetratricopeptide repeat protein, partial [Ruminiclostridium sp.]|nr:tetratricopeptide repeat protein [Ruminiclostridium sp.]